MKTEKNSENAMTDELKTLKADYEAASDRMTNCLLYPETREAVHKALLTNDRGVFYDPTMETKLYAHLLKQGQVLTPESYYLAARRQDYNNAFYAYDNALTIALASDDEDLDSDENEPQYPDNRFYHLDYPSSDEDEYLER